MDSLCRCEHPVHVAQCPHPEGCWCDTYINPRQCEDPWDDPDELPCGQCQGCLGL